MQGKFLNLRLFLEGIEVPVISAAVQVAPDAPAVASIQIIATDKVMEFLPRTVVHLFFYDYQGEVDEVLQDDGVSIRTTNNTEQSRYKLLFMGEVQALAFEKQHGQRAVVLTCVDFSNYWDTTFQYNFGGRLFGGHWKANFMGANTTLLNSPLGHGIGTISQLLVQQPRSIPGLTGLLAGIVRLLEAIGGWYYDNGFRGANDFTSVAELRLKLMQQVGAAEKDDSTSQLFARKVFFMWMNQQMQGLGNIVSIRSVVNLLSQFVFHECYPCPIANFTHGSDTRKRVAASVSMSKSRHAALYARMAAAAQTAVAVVATLKVTDTASGSASSALQSRHTAWTGLYQEVKSIHDAVLVQADLRAARRYMTAALTLSREVDTYFSVVIGGASGTKAILPSDKQQVQIAQIGSYLSQAAGVDVATTAMTGKVTYDRVVNQVLRPDIYFAPPPMCNVLFPELYSSISYSRNFFREVSRMELQTHNELLGAHELFNGRYFAPNIPDVRTARAFAERAYAQTILNHELFTGIIPMFQQMTEANIYAMSAGITSKAGQKVPYAQRAVNYLYFKHRFGARALQVQGHFHPWFLAGFPGLVIDRPMSKAQLDKLDDTYISTTWGGDGSFGVEIKKAVAPQYMGMCASLTHQLTQQGGGSTYQFTHARVHRESIEALGVDKGYSYKTQSRSAKERVAAFDREGYRPKTGDTLPSGAKAVGDAVKVDNPGSASLPLFRHNFNMQVGQGYDPGPLPRDVFPAGWSKPVVFTAFDVPVSVSHTTKRSGVTDKPLEECIAPPWIWRGWQNPKINDTYQEMFGTKSITSVKGFIQPGQAGGSSSTAVTSVEEAVDDLVRAYSLMKQQNIDVGEFLRVYGWRPVASMVDILGSSDLKIQEVVSKRPVTKSKKVPTLVAADETAGLSDPLSPSFVGSSTVFVREMEEFTSYVASGTEGFHSRAFGDVEDLYGLVNPTVSQIMRISRRSKVAKRMDVRKRRRAVVRAYLGELLGDRGLLG